MTSLDFWADDLTAEEIELIEYAGWDEGFKDTRQLGDNPAVVVIDVQYSMLGPREPLVEASKHYKTACGNIGWAAVDATVDLLAAAREHGIKIYYFQVPTDDPEGMEIADEIAPLDSDPVLQKPSYSAFFGTDFITTLIKDNIDTLIVVGGSTSGCVRATVTDADMHGFGVIVPPECVFDRVQLSHRATLLDIWMKRGQVIDVPQITEYFEQANETATFPPTPTAN